jgi:hypothetical protein
MSNLLTSSEIVFFQRPLEQWLISWVHVDLLLYEIAALQLQTILK